MDLVPLPQAYLRIREVVDDPASELHDVSDVVASDPALTGRVLRLVNSAYIGLMTPIDSIEHAVRILGMEQIHDMALATSAVGSLSQLRDDLFDLKAFWRLSVYCAGATRELAERHCLPSPSRLFVCGLLHNIGNLAIAHEMPQAFDEMSHKAAELERPWFALQREYFGFDYADVGAAMLRNWHLPEGIVQPVALHTRAIANLDDEARPLSAVLSLGATVARIATASEPAPDFDANALTMCGIDEDDIEALMGRLDDTLAQSLAALIPDPSR